eukprot:Rmarinus@m.25006
MEGFLYKAGVKNKAFKNRYFRLKGTQLSYYRSEKDGNPAGVVDLNGCVIKDHDAGKFEACICLYHPERNIVHDHTELILGTYARREMERWKKRAGFGNWCCSRFSPRVTRCQRHALEYPPRSDEAV